MRVPVVTAKLAYHHGDLRAALIDAALEVIAEVGPLGLTIRAVARRAGVSHAAPYRHYTGKDELILAVVEHGFELLDQAMAQARAAAPDDPLAQFAAAGAAYLDFALQSPMYYRVMFSGDLLNSKGQEALRHTSSASFQQIQQDLQICQDLGIVRPGNPLLQAIFIISTVHGFVSLVNDNRIEHLLDGESSIKQVQEAVMIAIFEGLGVH